MEKNENYADHSAAFHKTVIKMARSSILSNLYDLIGLSVQWQDFFIGTFKMYNQPVNVSHEKSIAGDKRSRPGQSGFTDGKTPYGCHKQREEAPPRIEKFFTVPTAVYGISVFARSKASAPTAAVFSALLGTKLL